MAVTLIAFNAALAIVILLVGSMGETEGRILATSLLATAAALLAMVQAPAARSGRIWPVPWIGIVGAVIGFAVTTIGIWTETGAEIGWKSAGSAWTLAVAGAIASILSGIPVPGRGRWLPNAVVAAVALAALMILGAIWFDVDSEFYWRVFGALAVLVAAGGLAIPILNRSATATAPVLIEHCPFCGADLTGATDITIVCEGCSREFSVALG
jgi:hypothetical protein